MSKYIELFSYFITIFLICITAYLFNISSSFNIKIGESISSHYCDYYNSEFEKCKSITQIEEFYSTIESKSRKNRMFKLKRKTFKILIDSLERKKNHTKSLKLIDNYLKNDDRDFEMLILKQNVLVHINFKKAKELNLKLRELFPAEKINKLE